MTTTRARIATAATIGLLALGGAPAAATEPTFDPITLRWALAPGSVPSQGQAAFKGGPQTAAIPACGADVQEDTYFPDSQEQVDYVLGLDDDGVLTWGEDHKDASGKHIKKRWTFYALPACEAPEPPVKPDPILLNGPTVVETVDCDALTVTTVTSNEYNVWEFDEVEGVWFDGGQTVVVAGDPVVSTVTYDVAVNLHDCPVVEEPPVEEPVDPEVPAEPTDPAEPVEPTDPVTPPAEPVAPAPEAEPTPEATPEAAPIALTHTVPATTPPVPVTRLADTGPTSGTPLFGLGALALILGGTAVTALYRRGTRA